MHYIAETDHAVTPPFMSDAAYAEARQCLPFVATDAVPYDKAQKVIYLAWRQATPAQGWWVIGGGVKNGQKPEDAMAKNFLRETSLDLPPSRFRLLDGALNFTQWTVQEQISNLHLPYGIELTPEELAVARTNLDRGEYSQGRGLRAFSLDALLAAIDDGTGYPQPVLYYDTIFGTDAFQGALTCWRQ